MANLVKMVRGEGMWYEEITPEGAETLEQVLGDDFVASIDQVLEALSHPELPLGATVEPDDLKPEDRILGICFL